MVAKAAPKVAADAIAKVSARYPVTRQLANIFGGYAAKGHKRVGPKRRDVAEQLNSRAEIVSEQLCDDLISYLEPSLKKHRGCTIIDVNPGIGLWSAKLHDHLKPKRHVLMEPDESYFEPYIKPLLDRSGSTFRHVPWHGAHRKDYWKNYFAILRDPELCPSRQELSKDDPRRLQLDHNLLVIGNLERNSSYSKKVHIREVPMAQLVLQHLTWAGLRNELFHDHGRVRMLWWAPQYLHTQIFYDDWFGKNPYGLGVSIGAHITKIAGVTPLQEGVEVYRTLESPVRESYEAVVQQRMRDQQIQVPPSRPLLEPKRSVELTLMDDYSPLSIRYRDPAALLKEIERVVARHAVLLTLYADSNKKTAFKSAAERIEDELKHTEFPQINEKDLQTGEWVMYGSHGSPSTRRKVLLLVDWIMRVVRLEANYLQFAEENPGHAELDNLKEQVLKLDASLDELNKVVSDYIGTKAQHIVDSHIMSFLSPSGFTLDRRNVESLKIDPEEIWPRKEMMMIDVVPTERDLSNPGVSTAGEGVAISRVLLKNLLGNKARHLPALLDHFAPNAAQDLIGMVPAITDTRKGGRMNPHRVRARCLTEDMIEGLAKAWYEWPFRPSAYDLAVNTGEVEKVEGRESKTSRTSSHEDVQGEWVY